MGFEEGAWQGDGGFGDGYVEVTRMVGTSGDDVRGLSLERPGVSAWEGRFKNAYGIFVMVSSISNGHVEVGTYTKQEHKVS